MPRLLAKGAGVKELRKLLPECTCRYLESDTVTNPFDLYALQTALDIRKEVSGTVTAITMGIPAAEKVLRDAIARGADDGMILSDRAFAGADTLSTSYTLSLGIKELGAQI